MKTGHIILLMFLLLPLLGQAETSRNYAENAQARDFADYMVREHGFEAVDLQALLGEATYKQSIIDAMNRPAEKVKEWKDYREIFVTEKRLRQGIEFWQAQRATLERAEAEFGVPPQIVVAIIGVETYYGRITGSYRVIDALTTLAFDYPRRSKFFTRELENFLLLSREQGLNPLNLKGSYAGAMGFGQFMPSSYRAYAVDYNEDGVADIWTDPVDAIGSVANYFHRHGWRTGDEVAVRARIAGEYQPENINKVVKPYMDLSALADQGFTPVDESLSADTRAIPLKLQGRKGVEFWLGLHNFYVITRYNTSFRYAMAVNQLSEKLLEQMANAAP